MIKKTCSTLRLSDGQLVYGEPRQRVIASFLQGMALCYEYNPPVPTTTFNRFPRPLTTALTICQIKIAWPWGLSISQASNFCSGFSSHPAMVLHVTYTTFVFPN